MPATTLADRCDSPTYLSVSSCGESDEVYGANDRSMQSYYHRITSVRIICQYFPNYAIQTFQHLYLPIPPLPLLIVKYCRRDTSQRYKRYTNTELFIRTNFYQILSLVSFELRDPDLWPIIDRHAKSKLLLDIFSQRCTRPRHHFEPIYRE